MAEINYTLDTINIWFPDQKEPLYDPSDEGSMEDFTSYWKLEKHRCINGFYLADEQVYISGWLYAHTVYAKIAAYVENEDTGRRIRRIITPQLRDIEWIVSGDFVQCELHGKFYDLQGSRDFGKSVMAASRAWWLYTFFDDSESLITGGADDYIKLATDKIEDILTNAHPIWRKKRLASDWKKEVKAGWKDKSSNQPNPRSSKSRILVRNYEAGNNSMAANGTRPGFHLIDETGTIPNLISCFKDSDACWYSGMGSDDRPSCLVMLAGTGGDMEVGKDAAEIFFNPEAYNILAFDNDEAGGKMGRFIRSTLSRMRYKEEVNLSEYLGITHPELERITILVSNENRCKEEWWDKEYAKARKSGNPKTILKFRAYWPLVPSDSFLKLAANDFNVDAAKDQIRRLKQRAMETEDGFVGQRIELYHDGEVIRHKMSSKYPITEFPVRDQSKDAPIMMYEPPMENPPWGLYIAAIDPYRHEEAESSDSLGVVYILKRIHSISSEAYQDMIVASFAARPPKMNDWNEQARMLIKWYNAMAFCENDEMSFIRYMDNKGDGMYLADVPQWLKDIVPFSTVIDRREKGVHSTEKTIKFYNSCLKNYCDDTIAVEKNDKGVIIEEHLGVIRIQDPMLLQEMVDFNKDDNFDRVRAAGILFAASNKMVPMGKVEEKDVRVEALFRKKPIKGHRVFSNNKSTMFSKKRNKFFTTR